MCGEGAERESRTRNTPARERRESFALLTRTTGRVGARQRLTLEECARRRARGPLGCASWGCSSRAGSVTRGAKAEASFESGNERGLSPTLSLFSSHHHSREASREERVAPTRDPRRHVLPPLRPGPPGPAPPERGAGGKERGSAESLCIRFLSPHALTSLSLPPFLSQSAPPGALRVTGLLGLAAALYLAWSYGERKSEKRERENGEAEPAPLFSHHFPSSLPQAVTARSRRTPAPSSPAAGPEQEGEWRQRRPRLLPRPPPPPPYAPAWAARASSRSRCRACCWRSGSRRSSR